MKVARHAIVTLARGHLSIWSQTHPRISRYAAAIGADFLKIEGPYTDKASCLLGKLEIYDLLNEYDRVLYVDGDVLVRPDCPDLFDIVPSGCVGATLEAAPYFKSRRRVFQEACEHYGVDFPFEEDEPLPWFNSGVFVVSRAHRALFEPAKDVRPFGPGWVDMPLLNCRLLQHGFPLHALGIEFNYIGTIALRRYRPFEPYDAFAFHATGGLRKHRDWYVRTVSRIWDSGAHERALARAWIALRFRIHSNRVRQ